MMFLSPRRRPHTRRTALLRSVLRIGNQTVRWYLRKRQALAQPRSTPARTPVPLPASRPRTRPALLAVPALGLALILPLLRSAGNSVPISQAAPLATPEATLQHMSSTAPWPCHIGDPLRPTLTDGCLLIKIAAESVNAAWLPLTWEEPDLAAATTVPVPEPESEPEPITTAAAVPVAASGLSWPALGRITSVLGPAHPTGIDIALDYGQPVYAAGDGRVAFAGWNDDYGYFAQIHHPGGYTTITAHFMRPASVRTGDLVRRGQAIGFAGSTGKSDGPHVHFEVHHRNLVVDPLNHLPRVPLVFDRSAGRMPSPSPSAPPTPSFGAATWLTPLPAPNAVITVVAPTPTAINSSTFPTRTPAPSTPRATAVATPSPALPASPAPTSSPTSRTVITRTPTPLPTPAPTSTPATAPAPAHALSPTPTPTPAPVYDIPGRAEPPAPNSLRERTHDP